MGSLEFVLGPFHHHIGEHPSRDNEEEEEEPTEECPCCPIVFFGASVGEQVSIGPMAVHAFCPSSVVLVMFVFVRSVLLGIEHYTAVFGMGG